MRVYLASPFFTPTQIQMVEAIEEILRNAPDVQLYSPRQDGIVLKDLPPKDRLAASKKVFHTNIDQISWCHYIVAVIDDRDPGTIWEMGFGYAQGKRIVTYTAQNYGLNVMLQCCVVAHVRTLPNLAYLFNHGVRDDICEQFREFHPEIT